MSRGLKALWVGVAAVVIGTAGSVCYVLAVKFYYIKSEYVTAEVIRATNHFVTEHPNQWPQSWQDLGGEDFSQYTDFRFDLTAAQIVGDRQLVYSAIQPKGHRYRTYPTPERNSINFTRSSRPGRVGMKGELPDSRLCFATRKIAGERFRRALLYD